MESFKSRPTYLSNLSICSFSSPQTLSLSISLSLELLQSLSTLTLSISSLSMSIHSMSLLVSLSLSSLLLMGGLAQNFERKLGLGRKILSSPGPCFIETQPSSTAQFQPSFHPSPLDLQNLCGIISVFTDMNRTRSYLVDECGDRSPCLVTGCWQIIEDIIQ